MNITQHQLTWIVGFTVICTAVLCQLLLVAIYRINKRMSIQNGGWDNFQFMAMVAAQFVILGFTGVGCGLLLNLIFGPMR